MSLQGAEAVHRLMAMRSSVTRHKYSRAGQLCFPYPNIIPCHPAPWATSDDKILYQLLRLQASC